ncbi:unnamed protein product [Vitrella brassicaformis CCMP3155]|uniref:Uncharacterized protein n=3 Tax=Vitrella brassicaformis TaxID=1169539 RepID=A0A0G4EB86_VITBC|nr:unnamed protein product [Vitrella brassicaformis CCMP3155]|eukprot:CEL92962.1 unnamed protein product [Vitrella brassicaformis CCMP3155]
MWDQQFIFIQTAPTSCEGKGDLLTINIKCTRNCQVRSAKMQPAYNLDFDKNFKPLETQPKPLGCAKGAVFCTSIDMELCLSEMQALAVRSKADGRLLFRVQVSFEGSEQALKTFEWYFTPPSYLDLKDIRGKTLEESCRDMLEGLSPLMKVAKAVTSHQNVELDKRLWLQPARRLLYDEMQDIIESKRKADNQESARLKNLMSIFDIREALFADVPTIEDVSRQPLHILASEKDNLDALRWISSAYNDLCFLETTNGRRNIDSNIKAKITGICAELFAGRLREEDKQTKETAVMKAAASGNVEVVRFLLAEGSNPIQNIEPSETNNIHNALTYCAMGTTGQQAAIFELLLSETKKQYPSRADSMEILCVPLIFAAQKGNAQMVAAILQSAKGGKVRLITLLQQSDALVVQKVMKNEGLKQEVNQEVKTSVQYAIHGGDLDVVKIMVDEYKADPFQELPRNTSRNSLMIAVELENIDIVRHLLTLLAKEPKSRIERILTQQDPKKWNVFHLAVKTGNAQLLSELFSFVKAHNLLNKVAEHIYKDSAQDPLAPSRLTRPILHLAAMESDNVASLKILLNNLGRISSARDEYMQLRDSLGRTALCYAIAQRSPELVRTFLDSPYSHVFTIQFRPCYPGGTKLLSEAVKEKAAEIVHFLVVKKSLPSSLDLDIRPSDELLARRYGDEPSNTGLLLRLIESNEDLWSKRRFVALRTSSRLFTLLTYTIYHCLHDCGNNNLHRILLALIDKMPSIMGHRVWPDQHVKWQEGTNALEYALGFDTKARPCRRVIDTMLLKLDKQPLTAAQTKRLLSKIDKMQGDAFDEVRRFLAARDTAMRHKKGKTQLMANAVKLKSPANQRNTGTVVVELLQLLLSILWHTISRRQQQSVASAATVLDNLKEKLKACKFNAPSLHQELTSIEAYCDGIGDSDWQKFKSAVSTSLARARVDL